MPDPRPADGADTVDPPAAARPGGGPPSGGAAERADAGAGRRIARASTLIEALFLAAKLVGLWRERVIGARFGISADYDAYVAAFRVPDLLFTLFAGGALVSAFLPVFAAALADDDRDGAWRLANGVTNLVVAATAVAAAAAFVAAEPLARLLTPDVPAAQQLLTARLMRIVLASTLIFAVSGLQFGILNAFQHFLTPALATVVYNLGIIGGAVWLSPRLGIDGLAWGVVAGAALHLAVKLPPLWRRGWRWRPVLALGDARVRRVAALLWPRMLSLGAVQAVFVANTRLASAAGEGALSALNYGWIISQMPQSILGTAVGTAAFPTLAELAARGRRAELRRTAADTLAAMTAATVPAAVALTMLAGPTVQVLLQTGRFDAEAAALTAAALRMFALGLLGHVTLEVSARLYYAQQDTRTPLVIALGTMAVNIALAVGLTAAAAAAGLGRDAAVAGIALANSVAVSGEVVVALWWMRRRLGGIEGRQLATALARAAAAGAAMAAAMAAAGAALPATPIDVPVLRGPLGDGLVRLAVPGVAGALSYGAAALALGIVPRARLARWLRWGRRG